MERRDREEGKVVFEGTFETEIPKWLIYGKAFLETSHLLVIMLLSMWLPSIAGKITAMITGLPQEEITAVDLSVGVILAWMIAIMVGMGAYQAQYDFGLKWMGVVVIGGALLATWMSVKNATSAAGMYYSLQVCGCAIMGYIVRRWSLFARAKAAYLIERYALKKSVKHFENEVLPKVEEFLEKEKAE